MADTGEWDRLDSLATKAMESWKSSTGAGVGEGRRLGVTKVTSGSQQLYSIEDT